MGLLRQMLGLGRARVDQAHATTNAPTRTKTHVCQVEALEPRCMLAADIHFGGFYFEEATGDDSAADTLQITFEGGAADTELTRVVINGDKLDDGAVTLGDVFFDVQQGGLGVFNAVGLTIDTPVGFTVDNITFNGGEANGDGAYELAFDLSGFTAGDVLTFHVDVDEQGLFNATALAEGGEFEGSRLTGYFSAEHYFDTEGTAIYFDRFDDNFAEVAAQTGSTLNLPPDNFIPPDTQDRSDRTAGAVLPITQTPLPLTISGTVFEDFNLNNLQDPGDPGIAGVNLALLRLEGTSYVATGLTTTTDFEGDYEFSDPSMVPGTYRVVETQPDGYLSVGAAAGTIDDTTVGSVLTSDIITGIAIEGGEDSIDNDFAETRPAELHGFVYHDRNNDGDMDPGEEGIAGVRVELQAVDVLGNPAPIIATTMDNGEYWFMDLMPGKYRVVEHHPLGWIDGLDAAGDAGGAAVNPGDEINGIMLAGNQIGRGYKFGEYLPGSIRGRVHADQDGDCVADPEERLLEGVRVELLNENGQVIAETTTNSNGVYAFTNLAPGTYGIREFTPDGVIDGSEQVGTGSSTHGGAVTGNDLITGIEINSGNRLVNYDFCEHEPLMISGWVYHDRDNDGVREPSGNERGGIEEGIGNVTIMLLDASGNPTGLTAVTNSQGFYKFNDILPGTYTLMEVHPLGWVDGLETPGNLGGVADNPGDKIRQVSIDVGEEGKNYNFGELRPGSISGRVHADVDGDCLLDEGEETLSGVVIQLLNADGEVIDQTTTDAAGEYRFDNLDPGTYGIREFTPRGYFDGGERLGTGSSTSRGVAAGNDLFTLIEINSGENLVRYDFCEVPPASISGTVHADVDGDCRIDPGEQRLSGVVIQLLDSDGAVVAQTTTNANGDYKFDGLAAGTYSVREFTPAGYFDGGELVGTGSSTNNGVVGGNDLLSNIEINPGEALINYNFCEELPGSISGIVHADPNRNCLVDRGEERLQGVVVQLLDSDGDVIRETTTNANGVYKFDNLAPGNYAVREFTPSGYFDGGERIGTGSSTSNGNVGGNDLLTNIEINSGNQLVNFNFCEVPTAQLSGYVFQDGDVIITPNGEPPADIEFFRDGRFTPDDTPIEGVVLELRNGVTGEAVSPSAALPGTYSGATITTVTDANGFYQFTGLRAGNYAVYEVQPEGYFDSLDTAGTLGGFAINPSDDINPLVLSQLTENPNDDAIIRIVLFPGQDSQQNNFSEIVVDSEPPIIPPPPEDPEPPVNPPGVNPPLATGTPLPVTRPVPLQLSDVPLPPIGGSGDVLWYTWHLSVVNAGHPRTILSPAALHGNQVFEPSAFNGDQVADARWQIEDPEGQEWLPAFGYRNAIPVTGDFNGDGISEIGVYVEGHWYIDVNGNGIWDDDDLWAKLGTKTDKPVTGDWDGDGKDDIGIFGPAWPGDPRAVAEEPGLPEADNITTGKPKNLPPQEHEATLGERTLQRTAGGVPRKDVIDHVFNYGSPLDEPVTGDFNGDGIPTIGVFRDGTWYLDVDGNGRWTTGDLAYTFGQIGDRPVIGDWDGNGVDQLGVYRDGTWILDTNRNGEIDDTDKVFELGGAGDVPVVGDWNGDGADQPGVFNSLVPERAAQRDE